MKPTPNNSQMSNKYASMSRRQLEEAAHDRLVASMEYNGEEKEVWEQISNEPTDCLIAFLEEE